MAEDWNAVRAEVAAAVGDVGHSATLIRKGPMVGPEWAQTPGPDQRIPVKLLGDVIALGLIDGSTIRAGDRREMMAAEGTEPTPDDHIEIAGVKYAIIRAEPYAPGGVALFYDLIMRA